jgi:uncharacterized protein with von Willebrand factor type A (vWA) domain
MSAPEVAVIDAVVALGRTLRARGLAVTVDGEVLVCQALGEIDVRSRDEVYWASRACFVHRPGQIPEFDAVFDRFWAGASLDGAGTAVEHGETDPRMAGPQQGGDALPQFRLEGQSGSLLGGQLSKASREIPAAPGNERGRGHRPGVLAAYSPLDVVSQRRRLSYEDAELAAVRALAAALRAAAPERVSRRAQRGRRAGQLDLRRTLRQAVRTDGDLVRPAYLAASRRPRRLLFLCDVSGSMERYSRVLLASLHAAVSAQIKAEAFVFATRLTRLTGRLSSRDVASALAAARAQVADWSGGTRIGEALSRFNRQYARLGLARGAIVIIASDGWDRGDPELLSRELQRLRLQCRRLVWLNPRPAELDGQPLAVGMRAALPCIDDFVPGHDPRAVEQLVRVISGLGEHRPTRGQRVSGASAGRR